MGPAVMRGTASNAPLSDKGGDGNQLLSEMKWARRKVSESVMHSIVR